MGKDKLKFAFFGTGDFAVKVLETLIENGYVPKVVVTAPDKPKGRKLVMTPPPIKMFLQENKEWQTKVGKILQPEKLDEDITKKLQTEGYELFVVADYGKIIPKEIIEIPKYKILNVHPSLLPKFRGASPIQSFILSGEEKTGTTIMLMDEEMDHGPVLAVQELYENHSSRSHLSRRPIGTPPRGTTFSRDFLQIKNSKKEKVAQNLKHKELEAELAKLGGQMLVEIIPDWIDGKINPAVQDHDKATYTKKIKKEDGLLKPEDSPEEMERKVRAFTPWPGAYFFVKKGGKEMRIIITDAKIEKGGLIIKRIKPEGKKEMPLEDFLRGNEDLRNPFTNLPKNIYDWTNN